jgi:hypothetical protein
MGDFRPAGNFLAQNFQRFRLDIGRFNDKGIRQRVAWQAGDNFGHAFVGLHALERRLFGHEAPFAGGGLLQAVFDITDISLAGIKLHEQADLLDSGGRAAEVAQIVEQDVTETGEGQRNADDE